MSFHFAPRACPDSARDLLCLNSRSREGPSHPRTLCPGGTWERRRGGRAFRCSMVPVSRAETPEVFLSSCLCLCCVMYVCIYVLCVCPAVLSRTAPAPLPAAVQALALGRSAAPSVHGARSVLKLPQALHPCFVWPSVSLHDSCEEGPVTIIQGREQIQRRGWLRAEVASVGRQVWPVREDWLGRLGANPPLIPWAYLRGAGGSLGIAVVPALDCDPGHWPLPAWVTAMTLPLCPPFPARPDHACPCA